MDYGDRVFGSRPLPRNIFSDTPQSKYNCLKIEYKIALKLNKKGAIEEVEKDNFLKTNPNHLTKRYTENKQE